MMDVLVACEESQEVCKAFRARGHRAFSCDIEKCSGGHPEWHILGDVSQVLDGDCSFWLETGEIGVQEGRWDLIVAFPPCTYLSNAGACRMYRWMNGERWINSNRYENMRQGREFFLKMLSADCDRIAVENPLPMKICELPNPTQAIQPFEFGHPYTKKTLLWLKNLPALIPTNVVDVKQPWIDSGTSNYAKGLGGGYWCC